ncbi:MAG: hypothetical protein DME57_03160 [Verrucomicrobia bacterium]|nr:MAG: hypothetical protein DME57_03160 [Verrucomicrobiota bacterium]
MDRGWEAINPLAVKLFGVALSLPVIAFVAGQYSCSAAMDEQKSPQIEYIAPNGQLAALSATTAPEKSKSSAAFIDHNTISCALHEGETTFIIELPKDSSSDRFTFLNENAAACGELRIAVSDAALPADSPKWTEVDGIVPFAHKRLFKLSILGVETKFVRLSFKVEGHAQKSAAISDPFRSSFLAAGIDSRFPGLHRDFDLHLITSVGALWTKSK